MSTPEGTVCPISFVKEVLVSYDSSLIAHSLFTPTIQVRRSYSYYAVAKFHFHAQFMIMFSSQSIGISHIEPLRKCRVLLEVPLNAIIMRRLDMLWLLEIRFISPLSSIAIVESDPWYIGIIAVGRSRCRRLKPPSSRTHYQFVESMRLC